MFAPPAAAVPIPADVAFVCRRVPDALLTAEVRASIAPATSAIYAAEERLVTLVPLPWQEAKLSDGTIVKLVGEGHVQLALYDLLALDEQALASSWLDLRIAPAALSRLVRTAVARGLPMKAGTTLELFSTAMRKALTSAGDWPAVRPEEYEFSISTDFSQPPYDQIAYLRWAELIVVRDLVPLGGKIAHAQGWGLLLFTMEPCWTQQDRWGLNAALVSAAGQWQARTQADHYATTAIAVRPEMFAKSALDVFEEAREWISVFVARARSVDREAEFTHLLALPSHDAKVQAVAFGQKIVDIVALLPGAESLKTLMGRTPQKHQLYSWYCSLLAKFLPKSPKFVKSTILALCKELAPRLSFVGLERYQHFTDEERFGHIISVKEEADNTSARGPTGSDHGEPRANFISSRLEMLHLTPRFLEAVLNIRAVLVKVPSPSSQTVLETVLRQAVPFLTQHILGKRNLEGHGIYRELGQYRCLWGTKGDVSDRLGLLLGQTLLKAHSAQAAPSLPGTSATRFMGDFALSPAVVAQFLEGSLESIEFENDLLRKVQCTVNGPCSDPPPIVDAKDRFLLPDLVDRMIDEVSPLFEIFGLGGLTDTDSFASLAQECKTTLRAIDGLGGADRRELKYGEHFGLQPFMLAALRCGGLTLKQLFRTDDPLVVVQANHLLQLGPMAFKQKLTGLHEALVARQHDQRVFGAQKRQDSSESKALEARIASLEKLLAQSNSSQGGRVPAPPALSSTKPKAGKHDNKRKSRSEDSRIDSSSWVGHIKAAGVWYDASKLARVMEKEYNFARADASRMCFAFGLDAQPVGDDRQRSCPCPKADGHEKSGARWHRFPKGFSFDIPKVYQDFR